MSASAKHLASGKNQAQEDGKPSRAAQAVEEVEAGAAVEEVGAAVLVGHSREELADLAAEARIAATTSRSA
jgi:hypothetical protein